MKLARILKGKGVRIMQIIHHKAEMYFELTPVIAVPVHAQARGSKYQGAFEIIKSPSAYEVTEIKTDFHAFTSSISKTLKMQRK